VAPQAAAGSGKTSVIVRRIQHILAGGAAASSVLAITFTKAALYWLRG
jgi:ATP-dependent exoDNAse (exonuclease V) beta subunit